MIIITLSVDYTQFDVERVCSWGTCSNITLVDPRGGGVIDVIQMNASSVDERLKAERLNMHCRETNSIEIVTNYCIAHRVYFSPGQRGALMFCVLFILTCCCVGTVFLSLDVLIMCYRTRQYRRLSRTPPPPPPSVPVAHVPLELDEIKENDLEDEEESLQREIDSELRTGQFSL